MSTSTQIALVLGMHRSGTSALAGLVSQLGFDVGQHLLPTNEFNEKGYYENEAIVNFHSHALEELHSSWHDLRILPDNAFRGSWLDNKVLQLASVLQSQFGSTHRIVVKDPRATRLLPIWKRLASETGVDLNYVVIGRHPLEVCYSLGHRDGFSRQKSLLLWLQYNLLAERHTRSDKRLILTYQDLIAKTETKAREVAVFLGIEHEAAINKAAAAIEPSIVHHTANNESWCEQADLRRWTTDTWRFLFDHHPPPADRLDAIFQELARRLEIFPDEATGLGDYRAAAAERDLQRKEINYLSLQEKYQDQHRSLEKVMRERDEIRAQTAEKYQEQDKVLRKVMHERDDLRAQAAQKYHEQEEALRRVMRERDDIRALAADKYREHEKTLRKITRERDELRRETDAGKRRVLNLQLTVKQKELLEEKLAQAVERVVAKQGKLDHLERELETLRHQWRALPLRRRLKKLAAGHTSSKLTKLNAVTPSVWNVSSSNFRFAGALFPDVSRPRGYSIIGWVIGEDDSPPQVRIVSSSARYQAKRGRRRIDVPLLIPNDKRAAQSGFAISDIKDGLQNKYRLEMRRPSAEWVTVAIIDFSAVGWHHFREIYEIAHARLLDTVWYAKRYGLKGLSQEAIISHYLKEGAASGHYPNPLFSTSYYLSANPDLCETGENPLLAYIRSAKAGNHQKPNEWFDPEWYLKRNKEVTVTGLSPLAHYLHYGSANKRNPGPKFDVAAYLARNPDVKESGLDPLSHFLHYGTAEGREAPTPNEQVRWVYERNEIDTSKRNVLLVGHVLGKTLFGSERSLLDLIQLIDREHFNIFCSFPQTAPSFVNLIEPFVAGVAVFPYEWWRGFAAGNDGFDRQFEEILRSRRINLVHVNSLVLRDPLIAARRLGIPGILHLREIIRLDPDLAERIGLPPETIAEKATSMSDFIIANSNVTRTQCGDRERSSVLYNTVDSPELDLPVRQRDGELRVAMVSSNLPKKGLEDFFAMARRAHEQGNPLSFWLVGPDNEWVQQHVESQTCPPNVHRTGYVERPEEILREVDVIVNLSTFAESFGRSVGEGMLARRPAVVYERGALPELVRDGIDGFVVPFRDVDQVLDRLNRLAQDPGLVAKMGESAHQRAKAMFSRATGAETLKRIYDQVLASAATSVTSGKTVAREKTAASTRKMRIGYFQWHFPVPSETFVLNELRHFLSLGHDVRVFCRQSPFKDFKPDFPVQWQQVQSPDELAAAISETNREIMHSHFVYPTVTEFLWPACEKAGVPFTFIAHAQDIFRHENIARNRLGEIGRSPVCHRVFAPGRFHRQFFIESGIPEEKIIVNPQPIPVDAYEPQAITPRLQRPRLRMCAIHRFVEKKALDNAIRAAGQLESLGISLYLYGYGPLEQSYRDLVGELKLDNVFFPGPVRDREHMKEVFRENDLFLCPSIRAQDGDMDGIPTILLEAMASHVPVIASRISSIPDLVLDDVTGYLCEPGDLESLTQTIRRFYHDKTSHIESIAENARGLVAARYNVTNANRTLLRTWSGTGLDIVLVTFNETARIKDVIERIYRFTKTPFKLYIVDNASEKDTLDYLKSVAAERDNVHLLPQKENLFVGPGTNKGVEAGNSAVAVYLCGREAYILSEGWDQRILDYMEDNPEVGLAGTLGYSPSYFTGADYSAKLEPFAKFRNPQFAQKHPDRLFQHVQGGMVVIRHSMFESIGGFSEAVPHNHTDVEYSYYVESCGWKLGNISGLVSLYHKTRPELNARLTETVYAVHPASPTTAPLLDAVVGLKTNFCNVCGTAAPFAPGYVCSNCNSTGFDRSLYRLLAESNLTYRRLKALLVGEAVALISAWKTMFQGMTLSYADFADQSEQGKGLSYSSNSFDLIAIHMPEDLTDSPSAGLAECKRILKSSGSLLYHQPYGRTPLRGAEKPDKFFDPDSVASVLEAQGFRVKDRIRYASAAVRYSDHIIFQCDKNS